MLSQFSVHSGDLYFYPPGKSVFDGKIFRADFARYFSKIKTTKHLLGTLRASVMGDLMFYTRDGATLCEQCVRENLRSVVYDIRHKCDTGWRVNAVEQDFEVDGPVDCSHCSKRIVEDWRDDLPSIKIVTLDDQILSF